MGPYQFIRYIFVSQKKEKNEAQKIDSLLIVPKFMEDINLQIQEKAQTG